MDWSKSRNRPTFRKEKKKMPCVPGGLAFVMRLGVCLWGHMGKSRCCRDCPGDKILDLCFVLYRFVIPSDSRPLMGDFLDLSYLK